MKKVIIGVLVVVVVCIGFYFGYRQARQSSLFISKDELPNNFKDFKVPKDYHSTDGYVHLSDISPFKEAFKTIWDALEDYYQKNQRYPDKLEDLVTPESAVTLDLLNRFKKLGVWYISSNDRQQWQFQYYMKDMPPKYHLGTQELFKRKLEIIGETTCVVEVRGDGYSRSPIRKKISGESAMILENVDSVEESKPDLRNLKSLILHSVSLDTEKLIELRQSHYFDELFIICGNEAQPGYIPVYGPYPNMLLVGQIDPKDVNHWIDNLKNNPSYLYYYVHHSPEPDMVITDYEISTTQIAPANQGGKEQIKLSVILQPYDKEKLLEMAKKRIVQNPSSVPNLGIVANKQVLCSINIDRKTIDAITNDGILFQFNYDNKGVEWVTNQIKEDGKLELYILEPIL